MKPLRLFLLALFACLATALSAKQTSLVDGLLRSGLGHNKGVTENIISGGSQLAKYNISRFHSVTLDDEAMYLAPVLENAVETDGREALSRESQRKNGSLYYAFYSLPPRSKSDTNRYLFFLNRTLIGGTGVVMVYIEGSATLKQIRKMLVGDE